MFWLVLFSNGGHWLLSSPFGPLGQLFSRLCSLSPGLLCLAVLINWLSPLYSHQQFQKLSPLHMSWLMPQVVDCVWDKREILSLYQLWDPQQALSNGKDPAKIPRRALLWLKPFEWWQSVFTNCLNLYKADLKNLFFSVSSEEHSGNSFSLCKWFIERSASTKAEDIVKFKCFPIKICSWFEVLCIRNRIFIFVCTSVVGIRSSLKYEVANHFKWAICCFDLLQFLCFIFWMCWVTVCIVRNLENFDIDLHLKTKNSNDFNHYLKKCLDPLPENVGTIITKIIWY